jgi:hypothetical protein
VQYNGKKLNVSFFTAPGLVVYQRNRERLIVWGGQLPPDYQVLQMDYTVCPGGDMDLMGWLIFFRI